MYSDFYKIPLPALRFEKVEETDTKSETTPKRTTPSKSKSRPRQKAKENDAQIKKSRFIRNKTTRQEDSETLPEQDAQWR